MAGTRSKRQSDDGPRRRSADDRWKIILDSAAIIFADRGFEATTIREVAESVGMLGGSLYYYIDSKEDLLYALIDQYHRHGLAAMAEVESNTTGDALTVLHAVIAGRVALAAHWKSHATVFHNEFRHLEAARQRDVLTNRRIHERRVEELIAQAQAEGTIDAEVNPRIAALSILAMTNAGLDWYRPSGDIGPAEIGRIQADLLVRGLQTRR